MNPKFSPKKSNKDGRSLISLRVAYNNTEFIYSTGEKISPEYWDNKKTIEHGKSQTDRVILPRGDGKKLIHQENKVELLAYIKDKSGVEWGKDDLLIGWARRFVTYKRPLAILDDVSRSISSLSE